MIILDHQGWLIGQSVHGELTIIYEGDPSYAEQSARTKLHPAVILNYRGKVRQQLVREHRIIGRPSCDYPDCKNLGSEMHELVNRGRSNEGTIQRLLTYQPELVSWLCATHHAWAHEPGVRETLLRQNILRYSRGRVERAFSLVKMSMPALDIELPSGNEV